MHYVYNVNELKVTFCHLRNFGKCLFEKWGYTSNKNSIGRKDFGKQNLERLSLFPS